MSLHSELKSLIAALLAGARPDNGRLGPDRGGLTQGGVAFDLRPVSADPFSWERRAEGLRANLRHRFAVELRETVTGKTDSARELAAGRMQTLVSGLADSSNLPAGSSIGQIVPASPVFRTESAANGATTLTARLELTVLEK